MPSIFSIVTVYLEYVLGLTPSPCSTIGSAMAWRISNALLRSNVSLENSLLRYFHLSRLLNTDQPPIWNPPADVAAVNASRSTGCSGYLHHVA